MMKLVDYQISLLFFYTDDPQAATAIVSLERSSP